MRDSGDQFADVDLLQVEAQAAALGPGDQEQVIDQAGQAACLLQDALVDLDGIDRRAIGRSQSHLHLASNDGQRGAQLMTDVREKRPQPLVFREQGGVGRLQLGGALHHGDFQTGGHVLQGRLFLGELLGHGVEQGGQLAQLVLPRKADPVSQVAAAERARATLQPFQPRSKSGQQNQKDRAGERQT